MTTEQWIIALEDGRKVKVIYQELPQDGAFISAQIERDEVASTNPPIPNSRTVQLRA
jgi:hypothetical protein